MALQRRQTKVTEIELKIQQLQRASTIATDTFITATQLKALKQRESEIPDVIKHGISYQDTIDDIHDKQRAWINTSFCNLS